MIITMQASHILASGNILPKDGRLTVAETVINSSITELKNAIKWNHQSIKMFGRWVLQPRLTAWYGDEGTEYSYSGLRNAPLPWTPLLSDIKRQIEEMSNHSFNSVLLNYYRDGNDHMGWHQDNEPELGHNPVIASLSLGGTRRFRIRHKYDKAIKPMAIDLEHGSVLIMSGETQNFWQHQVTKTRKPVDERINLTFRQITQSNH